ncbi:MAG: outer membrane beta-barrel protein [Thiogranum sp.]|nr:outer membrane beta-barrel protein [Thiogranum sp.]
MQYKHTFLASSLAFISASALPVSTAFAVFDKLEPYAYVGLFNDSNIFRVEDDEDDDTITRLGAGVDVDYKLSRQHLVLDAELERAEYDTFDDLSHTRVRAEGAWQWQVGSLWSGKLGYGYRDELASFDEFDTRVKDMRTTNYGFFDAGYQVHPDFEVRAGVNLSETRYEERDRLDRDTNSVSGEFLYRNTRNSRIGIRTKFVEQDLLNETVIAGQPVDNDYDETEISAVVYWEGTGKSHLEARLGYTDLQYEELDDRDFEGTTGRLSHIWFMSGKTRITTAIWRETDSRYDEIVTYVLSRGISVSPTWAATPKITVRASVSAENSDFKGENEIREALGVEDRDDDLWRVMLGATYAVTRNAGVSLSVSHSERDSSIDNNDYEVDQINAEARMRF